MEKSKRNYFKYALILLIGLFFVVYIIGTSGYYESEIAMETKLTEEAIKEFEEDVLNGQIVDLNTYIETEEKNYDNKFTLIGEKLNNTVITIFNDGVKEIGNIFSYLLS